MEYVAKQGEARPSRVSLLYSGYTYRRVETKMDALGHLAAADPALRDDYERMESLHEKKLWHQLSAALDAFLSNPSNNRGMGFKNVRLYAL